MMKAKVSRGVGARGLAEYILDEGEKATGLKLAEIVSSNCSGKTALEIGREVGRMAKLRPDCKKHVWHCSLSLPVGERCESHEWNLIVKRFLVLMELEPERRPYISVRHNDTNYDHVHIETSRIDFNGNIWAGKFEALKAIKATETLEKEFGLKITAGLEIDEETGKRVKKDKATPTANEINMAARTGDAPPKMVLQGIIDAALTGEKISTTAFCERLESAGVTVIPNIASTGKLNGFAFKYNKIPFKGSDLGDSYKLKKLEERGVIYEQATESAELISRRDRAKIASSSGNTKEPTTSITSAPTSTSSSGEPANGTGEISAGNGSKPEFVGGGNNEISTGSERSNNRSEEGRDQSSKRTEQIDKNGTGSVGRSTEESKSGVAANIIKDLIDGLGVRLDDWHSAAAWVADLAAPLNKSPVGHGSNGALKPDHIAKINAWQQQHTGLMAPYYRVTCIPRVSDKKAFNIGKSEDGEIFYTATQVENMISQLRRHNALGYDIYVTPIDPNYHYFVVDDVNANKLNALKNTEFKPCLIQESSDNNKQFIIKVSKKEHDGENTLANAMVEKLNKDYGDPKFTGVSHPFRMAGFSNKKENKNNFITKVVYAANVVCTFASGLLDKARTNWTIKVEKQREELQKQRAEHTKSMRLLDIEQQPNKVYDHITAFKNEWRKQLGLAKANNWPLDYSRIDFRVTKELYGRYTEKQLIEAILEASPNISERHHGEIAYATRTAQNAIQEVLVKRAERATKNDDNDSPSFKL